MYFTYLFNIFIFIIKTRKLAIFLQNRESVTHCCHNNNIIIIMIISKDY